MVSFIRYIDENDFEIVELLELLYDLHFTSKRQFKRFVKNRLPNHYIYVLEVQNEIVGLASLYIEPKLARLFVGHIDDVIVKQSFRGQGYGKKMVNHLIETAKHESCYKCVLSCNLSACEFYEQCGFLKNDQEMVLFFD